MRHAPLKSRREGLDFGVDGITFGEEKRSATGLDRRLPESQQSPLGTAIIRWEARIVRVERIGVRRGIDER